MSFFPGGRIRGFPWVRPPDSLSRADKSEDLLGFVRRTCYLGRTDPRICLGSSAGLVILGGQIHGFAKGSSAGLVILDGQIRGFAWVRPPGLVISGGQIRGFAKGQSAGTSISGGQIRGNP